MAKKPDPYGTCGGNGGYSKRKLIPDGLDKPLGAQKAVKATIGGSAKPTKKVSK